MNLNSNNIQLLVVLATESTQHKILTRNEPENTEIFKADRPLMRDTLNTPWLLTNRQLQWTGNSQLPLAELGKPSPNIDLLHWFKRESVNNFHCLTLNFDLRPWLTIQASQSQGRPSCQKSRSKVKRFKQESAYSKRTHTHTHGQTDGHAHTRTLPNVLSPVLRGQ